MYAIGLMSGTSMDGIDAAMIHTDGETEITLHETLHAPYDEDTRAILRPITQGQGDRDLVARRLTIEHAKAVNLLIEKSNITKEKITIIGFHGHTIRHEPHQGITVQIGHAATLAAMCNIDVVADFRAMDVTLGGQGAPLVPIYHWGLAHSLLSNLPRPLILLNLGGIANITYVTEHPEDMIAFDTGPANMLIDQWIQQHDAGDYDKNGSYALAGKTNNHALSQLLEHPYYQQSGPKSLDRYDLSYDAVSDLSLEDGAATLTALTGQTVADALEKLPEPPKHVLVCGGGAHNPAIMQALSSRISAVSSLSDYNIDPDFVEAQAFAYLAARHLKGLPISYPGTTGVSHAAIGGAFYPASCGDAEKTHANVR